MAASKQSSASENASPKTEGSRGASYGYVPSWWEKHFPRLLDFLAFIDPEPLGRKLTAAYTPIRAVVETLALPLAAFFEGVGRALVTLRDGALRALGAGVSRAPLPVFIRRWLWLELPATDALEPVDARLAVRRQYGVVLPLSLIAAVGIHAAVAILAPALDVVDFSNTPEELLTVELPPEVEIPPPPREIARPATPVIATTAIDEDITISPTTFDEYDPVDLPPPPAQQAVDTARVPTFTPFTVAPRILNTDLIEELMAQEYPPLLRDAGIGGVVVIWAYIDRSGLVEEVQVARSSGYSSLDEAGMNVAMHLRSSPALNRDVTIPVWIQVPLEFEVR